jgi:hypothetical protein
VDAARENPEPRVIFGTRLAKTQRFRSSEALPDPPGRADASGPIPTFALLRSFDRNSKPSDQFRNLVQVIVIILLDRLREARKALIVTH